MFIEELEQAGPSVVLSVGRWLCTFGNCRQSVGNGVGGDRRLTHPHRRRLLIFDGGVQIRCVGHHVKADAVHLAPFVGEVAYVERGYVPIPVGPLMKEFVVAPNRVPEHGDGCIEPVDARQRGGTAPEPDRDHLPQLQVVLSKEP